MTKTVLTFGDSNTYGTPPAHARGKNPRFGADVRWPGVMQTDLGDDWTVIEEGLRIALENHGPIDLLVLMLGTNDLQTHHAATPEQICGGVAGLLVMAKSDLYQVRHQRFEVLLICLPLVLKQGTYRTALLGAHDKSRALPPLLEALVSHWNIPFLNAGDHIGPSAVDGVHFEAQDRVTLGYAVAAKIGTL